MQRYKSVRPTPGQWLTAVLCILFLGCILLYPAPAAGGVKNGLLLCAEVVIPSLFPFSAAALLLFKTGLFTARGNRSGFWQSGRFGVFLLSMLAGYPVGARLVRELYTGGGISLPRARRMVCYCVNAGPAFVVIAVGLGVFGRTDVGWMLLAAHLLAACGLCFLFERGLSTEKGALATASTPSPFYFGEAFVTATAEACGAMFSVCGWVILFSAFGGLLAVLPLPKAVISLLQALLEVTTGIPAARQFGGLCAVAGLLGFSGFCVQFQVLSAAGEVRPGIGQFLLARGIHTGLSALLMRLFLWFWPLSVPTITFGQTPTGIGNAASVPAAVSLLFLCVVFFASVKQEQAL